MTVVLCAPGPTAGKCGRSLDPPSTWFHSPCLFHHIQSFDSRDKGNESLSDLLLDRPGLTSYLWRVHPQCGCLLFIQHFYLVCFPFSISYSVLPFHLVYVFQFVHLFFLLMFISQTFIKCSRKAFVYIYIYK